MAAIEQTVAAAGDAAGINRSFYDGLWSQTRLARPELFNTWPLVESLLPQAERRLEIGPGLRPRLPIAGSHFVDISSPVVERLNAAGAVAHLGDATTLPYPDASFDLVCAFDVIEHLSDDVTALAELARVLKEEGTLILSVPLHRALWSAFDDFVGHVRRYEVSQLTMLLCRHRLVPEQSAVFGMQPSNPRLLQCGMWFLTHRRTSALFWYDRIFLPLALAFQKPLQFAPGFIDPRGVAEVVVICRRAH